MGGKLRPYSFSTLYCCHKCHRDCDRVWLDSLYAGFDFKQYGFQPGERNETRDVVHMSWESLRGYLKSWSSYRTYVITHKGTVCEGWVPCVAVLGNEAPCSALRTKKKPSRLC